MSIQVKGAADEINTFIVDVLGEAVKDKHENLTGNDSIDLEDAILDFDPETEILTAEVCHNKLLDKWVIIKVEYYDEVILVDDAAVNISFEGYKKAISSLKNIAA